MRYVLQRAHEKRDALLWLPKNFVKVETIKQQLNVSNGSFWVAQHIGADTEEILRNIQMYDDESRPGWIGVPRNYKVPWRKQLSIRKWKYPALSEDERLSRLMELWKMTPHIKLRDDIQREANAALLKNTRDKILCLAPGRGKTVVSLYAAYRGFRFPVLIVVHTNVLMDQWRTRIKQFYGDRTRIGWVQGPKAEWQGYGVVLVMLQTLVSKKFPPEFYEYFKLVIFDEAHHLGAETFLRAAPMFPCERWGLSATPKRADKMDAAFQLHLGKICYKNLAQDLQPNVFFMNTGITLNERRYVMRWRGNKLNLSQMITHLSENEQRNRLILSWAERAARKNRTLLVLGERRSQLVWLYEACRVRSKGLHIGEMSQEDRSDALKKQIVFATQHVAREGLDRPKFDSLIITIPFGGEGRLQQTAGRILRVVPGKKKPTILVFRDNVTIFVHIANKMKRHLQKLGYIFKEVRPGNTRERSNE